MKKLFIFFAAVLMTAVAGEVIAQGTGNAPQIGSVHDYWVNADDQENQTSGDGNTYKWWVSNTLSDLKEPLTAGTDFTVLGDGIYGGEGGVNNFTIQLVWNPVSAGKTYFLVVEETASDGCINLKAVDITPVNAFEVTFAALDEEGNSSDNPERCAPDIALTADGTTVKYDYGSGEYIYKISSSGLYSDWTFDYAFVNTLGNATSEMEYSTDGTSYSSVSAAGTGISVDPDATGQAAVYFKVKVGNGATDGTYEEGTSGQSMVLTLTNISDGASAPSKIAMSDGTEFNEDVEQTQTVKARPATSSIGYN